ncbi:DUF4270 family protein [Hymenobacter caeli]|uniref:DUF4270 family protein n=1 Tax=Hymenobacter caeli TaxID=2735894 RepID=A0ABX2FVP0_9BACT|nr:DUF4270 family protein [Hymenobacter caeli]NRT20492.1 hypothetical protein [Hymenobacter caeli]
MRLFNKAAWWGGWFRPRTGLLGLLAAALLLAACSKTTSNLNDDLPTPAIVNRLAFYTDTVTVRTSTVLLDSVNSSSNSYLLVGRYVDPQLGTVLARSYAEQTLDAPLVPDATQVYDSLVLVLTPTAGAFNAMTGAGAYSYGDTTRVQQVEVHQLTNALRIDKPYYTKDDVPYGSTVLGQRSYRATRTAKTIRVKLSNALGNTLWAAGQAGLITDQDQFHNYLHGLVLTPGAANDAAVLRLTAAPALMLYHHAANDPATPLAYSFTTGSANPRFFHLEADRSRTALAALKTPGQVLSSTATGNRSFVEAGLGICTKLQFPYLRSFSQYGTTLVLNSALLQVSVPTSTENALLPLPTLTPQLVDRANHPSTTVAANSAAARAVNTRTNLEQYTYTVDLLTYVQGILANTISYDNDGILLNPGLSAASPGTINRAVLGSMASPDAQLQLRVYYTRVVQ